MKLSTVLLGLLGLPVAIGCGEVRPSTAAATPKPTPPSFAPETAGAIRGHVAWQGDIPRPAPYRVSPTPVEGNVPGNLIRRNNPNTPLIDPRTLAVGNAVVFLRGIDSNRARPWDHPTVRVELNDYAIHVGEPPGRPAYGFVRRGDAIRVVSRQPVFQSLHADGACFFTLPFPDPNEPLTRRLTERGVVELTSAAGYFWMRAYLFVDDHPYYTGTGPDGVFELSGVPAGDYELVCWLPNWIEKCRNRAPESGLVTRIFYRPPVEIVRQVRVETGKTREVSFVFSATAFEHCR